MKKIISRWMLISLGVGMVPVLILGASQGGIALSPFILMFFIVLGLMGGAIHANINAYRFGARKQKIQASIFAVASILVVGSFIYGEVQCELKLEYATERAKQYIGSKPDLDIKNLGSAALDAESCVCTFEYSSPAKTFTIIVTEYGKLHFSPH